MISPLLSNLYLHWFDRAFQVGQRQGHLPPARLVRYADDFVVLAPQVTAGLVEWIEQRLEQQMRLVVNRAKTKVVHLQEAGSHLEFLGYTFRYGPRERGGRLRALQIEPSAKTMTRERDAVRQLISAAHSHRPLPSLLSELDRQLQGWAQYFRFGACRKAYRQINYYVQQRVYRHLQQRSQRAYRVPQECSFERHLQRLGLRPLRDSIR